MYPMGTLKQPSTYWQRSYFSVSTQSFTNNIKIAYLYFPEIDAKVLFIIPRFYYRNVLSQVGNPIINSHLLEYFTDLAHVAGYPQAEIEFDGSH